MDERSKEMLKAQIGFAGEGFLQTFDFLGLLQRADTSVLEARHSTIRRMLGHAAVQTHRLSFDELSARSFFAKQGTRLLDHDRKERVR